MTDTATAAPSECAEAFRTEFCPYKGAPDPWVVWQAAWASARRAQPTPPAVVEPLTDEQAKAVLWAEHLRWMEAAGLDTEGMQPTGEWLDHWLLYVRAIERAQGIGIKKENGNG